ncbi:hybrid sensor histidine kinase/response regulator [Paludisphaera soli]|uniref:hybrid sensor histidine kinase/response regulator n=1 Tax=Paludisphaera soli TaxID=2712865 RepID=UPI0013EB89DF|nr:ATP-binding protein [Paludisphaera soli]
MSIEAALRIVERMPEALLLVTREGLVLGANRRVARLGLNPAELVGRDLAGFGPDPDTTADYLRRCARASEPVPGTLTLAPPAGELRPYRCDGSLLQPADGDDPAVLLLRLTAKDVADERFLALNEKLAELNREIARRRQVEEELRDQREWLRVTLVSIGDALIATDVLARVVFMNTVAEELTGWRQAEAHGRPLEQVFRIFNEESRAQVENPVTRVLREGKAVGLTNHTLLIARDGVERPIDDTAAPIRGDGGVVQGVVLVFHDVGDRRALERSLHERAEKLAENDRRKDEFLAMLAHELRNPLSSIGNAAGLLRLAGDDPKLNEWAQGVIERQVKHLARLIEDLIDVSRITRGKIVLRKRRLDARHAIQSAVESIRPHVDEKKQELTVACDPEELWIEADPTRLEQVVINLLTNACRYTEAGGRIELTAGLAGGRFSLSIKDSGIGIPPDQISRMFELFAQGDRSIARSEGGLGIGLTVVKHIAELHGGTATAYSEGPGRGSEFTVSLPVAAATSSDDADSHARGRSRPPSRILVVDDNVDTARGLHHLFALLGDEVRTVHDGSSAIAEAVAFRPSHILLDIGLPAMDGFEVATRLRAEGLESVIIAVSGYGRPEDRLRGREAGFDHHLVKPVDHDQLIALIGHSGE